jgi:hypothetical protein
MLAGPLPEFHGTRDILPGETSSLERTDIIVRSPSFWSVRAGGRQLVVTFKGRSIAWELAVPRLARRRARRQVCEPVRRCVG